MKHSSIAVGSILSSLAFVGAAQAGPGGGEPNPDERGAAAACLADFDTAQAWREQGKLVGARDKLIACAQEHCPDIIENKCSDWLTDLEKVLPSIIVAVEPAPNDIAGTAIAIDGAAIDGGLSGRAVYLDPGPRHIRVSLPDGVVVEDNVVVTQGEQNRKVVLRLEPDPALAPPEQQQPSSGGSPLPVESSGLSPLVWVGFGLAAAGAVAGGVTGGMALSTSSRIEDECGGYQCDSSYQQELDQGEVLAHVSTASFVVAGAGAALGVVGLLLSGDEVAEPESAAVRPWIGWGAAGVRGAF